MPSLVLRIGSRSLGGGDIDYYFGDLSYVYKFYQILLVLYDESSYCKLIETGEWSETLRFFAELFKFSFNAPIPNLDVSY